MSAGAAMTRLPVASRARGRAAAALLGILGASAALTGCGSAQEDPAGSSSAPSSASSSSEGEALVSAGQPWLKAADSGMTAAFGELTNEGEAPVTLIGASAEGVAGEVDLHETVLDPDTGATVMQAKEEPTVIEPGESVTLEPGGDHLMLMDLQCAPMAGTVLEVELRFEGGATQVVEMPVRDYAAAQEEYAPGEEPSASASETHSMDGMDGMHETAGSAELPLCESSS